MTFPENAPFFSFDSIVLLARLEKEEKGKSEGDDNVSAIKRREKAFLRMSIMI